MSKNIDQVYIANPITSNVSTDLMYFGQSPYGAGNDAAMTYANFSAQFIISGSAVLLSPSGNQTITAHNLTVAVGNITAGSSGNAGTFVSFPASATSGSLSLAAVNSSGNYAAVISNASLGQATTWSLPDPGAATATIGVNTGSLTSGHLVSYNGTAGLLQDSGVTASSISKVLNWTAAASTPITAAVNTGYYITDASQVTITLPATAAAGSVVAIVGNGAGGWILAPGSGQTIKVIGSSASTSITSAEQYDCIEVLCTVANTTWVARSLMSSGVTIV